MYIVYDWLKQCFRAAIFTRKYQLSVDCMCLSLIRTYLDVHMYMGIYVGSQCNGLASQTVFTVLTCLLSQSERVH